MSGVTLGIPSESGALDSLSKHHGGAAPASLTEYQGRLAQSEERYVHIVEVVGSRPASPTRSRHAPNAPLGAT